jgi:hypothetical protein
MHPDWFANRTGICWTKYDTQRWYCADDPSISWNLDVNDADAIVPGRKN